MATLPRDSGRALRHSNTCADGASRLILLAKEAIQDGVDGPAAFGATALAAFSDAASFVDSRDGGENEMKRTIFNLLPPMTIAVVILFWAFGPTALLKNSWTIVVTSAVITAFVQGLEWLNERHAGWRLD